MRLNPSSTWNFLIKTKWNTWTFIMHVGMADGVGTISTISNFYEWGWNTATSLTNMVCICQVYSIRLMREYVIWAGKTNNVWPLAPVFYSSFILYRALDVVGPWRGSSKSFHSYWWITKHGGLYEIINMSEGLSRMVIKCFIKELFMTLP